MTAIFGVTFIVDRLSTLAVAARNWLSSEAADSRELGAGDPLGRLILSLDIRVAR